MTKYIPCYHDFDKMWFFLCNVFVFNFNLKILEICVSQRWSTKVVHSMIRYNALHPCDFCQSVFSNQSYAMELDFL